MNNGEKSVESMNFDELRSYVKTLSGEIKELTDLYARTIREYDDLLHNLTGENFSVEYKKQLKDGFGNFSTIEQTASAIKSVVSGQVNLSAAKEIESVDKIPPDAPKSNIYVIRSYALGENDKVTEEQYYYYNVLTKSWEQFFGDSVYTVFEQTDHGFQLKGNVLIDGSLISTGTIQGVNFIATDPTKTDQSVKIIAKDEFAGKILLGTVGEIYANEGIVHISTKSTGGNLSISGNTIRFTCDNVEGLGVVPVFGG